MHLRTLSGGRLRIHMHDEDDYEITDDNGVNVDLTRAQMQRIAKHLDKIRGRV